MQRVVLLRGRRRNKEQEADKTVGVMMSEMVNKVVWKYERLQEERRERSLFLKTLVKGGDYQTLMKDAVARIVNAANIWGLPLTISRTKFLAWSLLKLRHDLDNNDDDD